MFLKPTPSADDGDQGTQLRYGGRTLKPPSSPGESRHTLPIHDHRDRLLYALEQHRVVIVVGDTGCGKTTQIPQMLLDAGWCGTGSDRRMIGCTQPRRVSTVTVAQRVAQERGAMLGDLVGYAVQFDNRCTDGRTLVKYMTDGILLREMMADPLLMHYSVIMVDEAHERSINTDIILGLLKKILRKRPELRLVVSSATLEADKFKQFFQAGGSGSTAAAASAISCCVLHVPGSTFPVDVMYLSHPTQNYVSECVDTVVSIHKQQPLPGDILVFLTGQEEIDMLIEMLTDRLQQERTSAPLLALPLYAGLPVEEQIKVFQPTPRNARKVVVATNIAETSITIEGITHVIDCGFAKLRYYDPQSRTESLVVAPISKSSAVQRAGRAGRVQPGTCYRLYTEDAFRNLLPEHTLPEIQRADLSSVVVQLKALGIGSVSQFDFVTRPPVDSVRKAEDVLRALGALDTDGALTYPVGFHISQFPVAPKLAKMLLASGELHCSEEAATIVAILSVRNLFSTAHHLQKRIDEVKKQFAVFEGDHFTYLNIYAEYQRQQRQRRGGGVAKWCHDNYINYRAMRQIDNVRSQLVKYMAHFGVPIHSITQHPGYERPITSAAHMRQKKMEQDREARHGTRLPVKKGGYWSDDRNRQHRVHLSSTARVQHSDSHDQKQDSHSTERGSVYITNIKQCIVHGYFENVAQRCPDGETYEAVNGGERLRIHRSSVLSNDPPPFVLYGEVMQTLESGLMMRHVMAVDARFVQECVPSFYEIRRTKV